MALTKDTMTDEQRKSVVLDYLKAFDKHRDGEWRAGTPEWGAGRWCDVFEIRDWKIQRAFIYLDPDYAGRDTERYSWLNGHS